MRCLVVLACSSLLTSPLVAQSPSPQQLDLLIKEALAQWQVPGVAVAIVRDDRLVYLKGFGVKELGKDDPVTADTIFPLASCSKPLTVTALATLVDQGKLDWDDRVRKHLPWFQLADRLADANVTLRDLLTHRTGLGRHEALWYRSLLTVEERAKRLRFLELSHPFRSTFDYQATTYGTAGLAGAQAAGSPWRELITQKLFVPLGMDSAAPVFPEAAKSDCASPHKRTAKGVAVIERYPLDEPDPAGSIHASARDLSKFLRLQLSGGMFGTRRLVSEASLGETHLPQIVIRPEPISRALNPHSHVLSYTLGWIAQDYRGHWLLTHGGTVDGFRVQLTLVPDLKLGIALMNNLDRTWMNLALTNTLLDRYCDLQGKNWHAYFQSVHQQHERDVQAELQRQLATQKPNTKPSLPLEAYAGTYSDPAYGVCRIRVVKEKLIWEWGKVQSQMEHFHFDTFIGLDEPVKTTSFTFVLGKLGDVASLRVMDRTFHRQP